MRKWVWVAVMVLVCANSAWAGSHAKTKKKSAPRAKPGATTAAKKKKLKKASFFGDMKQMFVPPSGKDAADLLRGSMDATDDLDVEVKSRGVNVKGRR